MIWFEELQTRKQLSKIFSTYETTFSADERREKEQFLNLINAAECYIYLAKENETAIGYLIVWQLSNCCFLEHFEVFEAFRNRQYGQLILKELTDKFGKIVLETEPSELNEMAGRRLGFYERNGFSVISWDYLQPSYGADKSAINLNLMSNYSIINIQELIRELHAVVYH